ncbi:MAG TPA: penicillin acylase family protein [Kofleriaceae bacterium]|nr:penicillin acylase family protein [Kofleriaceae bacterium]
MRWPGVFALVAVALAGCVDDTSGPFDGLPLDGEFTVGVTAPVHVARDRYGIAHIQATTPGDAAFVQGYVMAHDRLPQMDVLRRMASGTLAELYGVADPAVIDGDLEIRIHRLQPLALATWTALEASTDPIDQELVEQLAQYAGGVNAYITDLQRGKWSIDPALAASFDPAQLTMWSAVDSLAIGRWWALAQAFTVPYELDATELYQKLRAFYDAAPLSNPAAVARRDISRDLWKLTPVGTAPTIDGFPNVAADTGSRADGSGVDPGAPSGVRRKAAAPATDPADPVAPVAPVAPVRPTVPQPLLDAARTFFTRGIHNGPLGALGSHAFQQPHVGGDAWVVGASLTSTSALLASDHHLQLTNPALFCPTHLIVQPPATPSATSTTAPAAPALDLLGITIPGIPGILFGTNGAIAWSGTASLHDVNDVYLEQIGPCGGAVAGDCVAWTDPQGTAQSVPIATDPEDIQVGTLGAISSVVHATYERVPHHGPIIPAIDPATHTLVPRAGGAALSFRSTGDAPTFELRALVKLAHAQSVTEGFAALADATYGGQSWVVIDRALHIGWTTEAELPQRAAPAYAWDPLVAQDAPAPFFVLPGDGSADWLPGAAMAPRYLPHAVDPAQGFLIAGNADPVGATLDGKPLDQRDAGGATLYAGVAYAAGLRQDRATAILPAHANIVSLDDLAALQSDTHSSAGERLAPVLLAALGRLDRQAVGPPDVNPYLDALAPGDLARLTTARGLLARWTFATPAAIDAPDQDSAATALFNTWIHFFIERTLEDELDAVGFDVWRLDDEQLVRVIYAMLHDPNSFVTSPATQQPILCDNYAVSGPDDSCTKAILQSMVDAMAQLESPQGFGTADPAAWRWGALHQLAITPLVGGPDNAALSLAAIPRPGDNFAINRGDPGWADLDFSTRVGGAAARLLATADPYTPIAVSCALAGGVIFDTRSPHYRDLLDQYYLTDRTFVAPDSTAQIVAAGETRWVFH